MLARPPRHRVRWAEDLAVKDAELLHEGRSVPAERDGSSLLTRAAGALVLRLGQGAAAIDVPVRLPVEEGAAVDVVDVVVDPARDGRPAGAAGIEIVLRRPATATGEWAQVDATDGRASYTWHGGWTSDPIALGFVRALPAVVRVRTSGFAPRVLRVDRSGIHEAAWPDTRLDLTVLGKDGNPAPFAMFLDGERYAAPEGRLEVAGLAPGRHVAILDRGISWRFTIEAGPPLVRTLRP